VRLRHEALPECALEDVDLATVFLGRRLSAPLVISSMTGGTERAWAINRNLAAAAERFGIALGLGSQKAAIENSALLATYRVRDVAPNVVLFANVGAVSLNYGIEVDDVRRAIDAVAANGLYLHLNPLQEALQPNGDTNFRDLLPKIAALCRGLEVPVIAKSVGSGLAVRTAARLLEAGVSAIDVSRTMILRSISIPPRCCRSDSAASTITHSAASRLFPSGRATPAIPADSAPTFCRPCRG